MIWTRVSGGVGRAPVAVRWRIARGRRRPAGGPRPDRWRAPRPTGRSASTSAGCGRTRATLYDFEVDGERSPSGPDADAARRRPGVDPVRPGVVRQVQRRALQRLCAGSPSATTSRSCSTSATGSTRRRRRRRRARRRARTSGGRSSRSTSAARSRTTGTRYAQYRRDPDVQAVSAAHPFIATVDDHEFADGAWRDGATEHKPERDGPWSERKAAAFRAREEWLPVRRPDPGEPGAGLPRRSRIGSLAELFLLDTRTHARRARPAAGAVPRGPHRPGPGPEGVAARRRWPPRRRAGGCSATRR